MRANQVRARAGDRRARAARAARDGEEPVRLRRREDLEQEARGVEGEQREQRARRRGGGEEERRRRDVDEPPEGLEGRGWRERREEARVERV